MRGDAERVPLDPAQHHLGQHDLVPRGRGDLAELE